MIIYVEREHSSADVTGTQTVYREVCVLCCLVGLALHGAGALTSLSDQQQLCADDGAVKCGVDVFSDFVALVCSKDSPARLHLRQQQQQQQQPVSSLLSHYSALLKTAQIYAPFLQRVRIVRSADRCTSRRNSVRLSVRHIQLFCPDE